MEQPHCECHGAIDLSYMQDLLIVSSHPYFGLSVINNCSFFESVLLQVKKLRVSPVQGHQMRMTSCFDDSLSSAPGRSIRKVQAYPILHDGNLIRFAH